MFVCSNPACKKEFPVVNEIPVIFKNVDEVISKNYYLYFEPLSSKILDFLTPKNEYKKFENLAHTYINSHYHGRNLVFEEVENLLSTLNARFENSLDMGCATGGFLPALKELSREVFGIDSNFLLLRHAAEFLKKKESINLVNCDALDPPFVGSTFDLILSLNLIDSVPNPYTLVGQMDALLKSGGILILATPFAWNIDITPLKFQFQEEELLNIYNGKNRNFPYFRYEIANIKRKIRWTLKEEVKETTYFVNLYVILKK